MRNGINLGVLSASALALALLLGGRAQAESAKTLFYRAERAYDAAKYERALALYRAAYRQRPLAGFFFNIGQCHRQLKNYGEAIRAFERYLAEAKRPVNAPRAKRMIQRCKEILTKQAAASQPKPPKVTKPPPPKAKIAPPPPPKKEPLPEPETASSGLWSGYFWIAATTAVALVAAGSVTGAMALSKSSTYNDPTTPAADLAVLRDDGELLRTISTATIIGGATVAVSACILLFLTDWDDTERPEANASLVSPWVTRAGAGLAIGGTF